MSLKDKNVLVLGGTGYVGSGAILNFLKEGSVVVVPSRTEERLQELLKKFPKETASKQLIGVVGGFATKAQVEETYKNVKLAFKGASPDHVVSSLGFATMTPKGVLESDAAILAASFDESLYPSIFAAQVILSDIKDKENATYTIVSGGLAHICPMPGAWAGTIKNAALNAFFLALASDTAAFKVRTNCACLHYSVSPIGVPQNQFGMPTVQNTEEFSKVFVKFTQKPDVKGKLVCFESKEFTEKF